MPQISETRYRVDAGWDHAPHLSEEMKRQHLASTPPYLRDARSKGIPSLGEGAIYDIPLDEVLCEPFQIPAHWRRGYGLDVGWNYTAAVWIAEDPNTMTHYVYAEYKAEKSDPLRNATAIKARGANIRGAIDPASKGVSQADGRRLFDMYQAQGLKLSLANNEVEAGISTIWLGLSEGRIQIFRTCTKIQNEYRLYHRKVKRDKDGVEKTKITKKNDHLLDAWRYGEMTWDEIATIPVNRFRAPQIKQRATDGTGL